MDKENEDDSLKILDVRMRWPGKLSSIYDTMLPHLPHLVLGLLMVIGWSWTRSGVSHM